MAFHDHTKVQRGWSRGLFDTAQIVETGTTSTHFRVRDNIWPGGMINGFVLQFITGQLNGVFYNIVNSGVRFVDVDPDQGIIPAPGDHFAVLYPPNPPGLIDIEEALKEDNLEVIANNEDISGGVDFEADDPYKWRNSSLYIRAADSINIDLEFAAEAGDFYQPEESPLVFSSAGTNIYEINFVWKQIRLTGSNANLVTAKLKGLV